MRGQSRGLRTARDAWSAPLAAATAELPKLTVRVRFPSPAPCDLSRDRGHREPTLGSRCSSFGAGWASGRLVVAGGVEFEGAQQFSGGGVDDADVAVGG